MHERLLAAVLPRVHDLGEAWLRDRTRFLDRLTIGALETGFRQIVLIGPGYDCRALRYRAPGVRWFEIDDRQVQADKLRRLEDIGAALAARDHDPKLATLFLCEEAFFHLSDDAIARTLAATRARANDDSRLGFAYALGGGTYVPFFGEIAARLHPHANLIDAATFGELLHSHGWDGDTSTHLVNAKPII